MELGGSDKGERVSDKRVGEKEEGKKHEEDNIVGNEEVDADIPLSATEEVEDYEDRYEHYTVRADPGQQPMRLDLWLQQRVPTASRTRIQAGIEAGAITLNGKPTKASYKIKPGDVASLHLPTPPRTDEILPEDIELEIVYEDSQLLIVNKRAGMVVHPAHGNWTGTLVNALIFHLDTQLAQGSAGVRPGLVHRIDKDTSGLLVVAKTDLAMAKLARQFFYHTIERKYFALVWGTPEHAQGRIEANIGRSPKDRRLMEVKTDPAEGKRSVTNYRVLEQLGPVTLVECKLETGRTHQIRAHMKYMGHPLFGDSAYGGAEVVRGPNTGVYKSFVKRMLELCPRQALHAATLGFEHPTMGKQVYFEAMLPSDFRALLSGWRERETG
jgi:23S rRNA pseudouridine1911/1915/1917 synthase